MKGIEKMRVFLHQIYECRKGVRSMALCSLPNDCMEIALNKLEINNMSWFISPLNQNRFNIFFGDDTCVEVARKICNKPLNMLSAEEDFILGTLLGYSVREQSARYCKTCDTNDQQEQSLVEGVV